MHSSLRLIRLITPLSSNNYSTLLKMASSTPSGGPIVLYHYPYSPYARRIVWYLSLRGIPYSQCIQPPIMPRPDVAQLGIRYRRIPILSIGRDIYLDTRLMLQKLEALFPEKPRLGGTTPDQRGIERLLESFVIDSGVFNHAVTLLPTDLPLLTDPKYYSDRAQYLGHSLSPEGMKKGRPNASLEFRRVMTILETTFLADDRQWILKTEGPTLADIEAIWPFHWISGIPGALDAETFSPKTFPKVYAWIARFQKAVSAAKKASPWKTPTLSGDAAVAQVLASPFNEQGDSGVDVLDAVALSQGLKVGDRVVVYPTDTGSSHKDVGTLVKLDMCEVVFEVRPPGSGEALRVHAPRHGFRVVRDTSDGGSESHL